MSTCVRSECTREPVEGLDVCDVHHQEILMGLDECRASGCDKRVPFGSLWCSRHAAMRTDGTLTVDGIDLSGTAESRCRLCAEPALKRTVGKRPQGGWNDLCQTHYDEKCAKHSESLAVAREALPAPNGKPAPPPKRVGVPAHLRPANVPRAAPEPVDERERRAAYLLEHDWALDADDGDRWFLPVNVTQPLGGRELDEAYDWQVAIESGRERHELTSGTAPSRDAHDPRCTDDPDHDGECTWPGDGVIRSDGEHEPVPAGAVIRESTPVPLEMALLESAPTAEERVLFAYAEAIADALTALGSELCIAESMYTADHLAGHVERLLRFAPGIRIACELLGEISERAPADAVPSPR